MGLVAVIARKNILILFPQKGSFLRIQLQGDVVGPVSIVQTDGGKHLSSHLIADPVPFRLQILLHGGLLQQIFIYPWVAHTISLLYSNVLRFYFSRKKKSFPFRPKISFLRHPLPCFFSALTGCSAAQLFPTAAHSCFLYKTVLPGRSPKRTG